MGGIGIVGAGISGLHLALYLQREGVPTTLYSPTPMAALAEGPVQNFVVRWAPTLDRERSLGLVDPDARLQHRMRIRIAGTPIDVEGALSSPADTTDFRRYLPWLLHAYLDRGGDHRVTPCGPDRLPDLVARHDLVVVTAGRDGFSGTFPVDEALTVHRTPPRRQTVALYRGLALPDDTDIDFTVVPGVAEVIQMGMRSRAGMVSMLSVSAIPEGPLGDLSVVSYTDDPAGYVARVLDVLRTYVPRLLDRVDESEFAPTRPLDALQGSFVPRIRRAWTEVDGRPVMAIGDVWVLNDPLMAQGANLGSRCAFILGAAIARGGPFDAAFARETEQELWAAAAGPTALTNAFLAPPPPPVVDLLAQATGDPHLATRIADGLGRPEEMLALLSGQAAIA